MSDPTAPSSGETVPWEEIARELEPQPEPIKEARAALASRIASATIRDLRVEPVDAGYARIDEVLCRLTQMMKLCRSRAEDLDLKKGERLLVAASTAYDAIDELRVQICDMPTATAAPLIISVCALAESLLLMAETAGALSKDAKGAQAGVARRGRATNGRRDEIDEIIGAYQAKYPEQSDWAIGQQLAPTLKAKGYEVCDSTVMRRSKKLREISPPSFAGILKMQVD